MLKVKYLVYKKVWKTGAAKVEEFKSCCLRILEDCTGVLVLFFLLKGWIKQVIAEGQDDTFFEGSIPNI